MTQSYIQVDDNAAVECDNCGWTGIGSRLNMISDIEQRLDAGGIIPAGQCPDCGALAYLAITDYEARVRQLEAEGMTRSDAQGVADAELMTADNQRSFAKALIEADTLPWQK